MGLSAHFWHLVMTKRDYDSAAHHVHALPAVAKRAAMTNDAATRPAWFRGSGGTSTSRDIAL